jgi:GNAT superfamily N-acetyltransferase
MGSVIREAKNSDIQEIVELQAIVWQDHFFRERNMQVPMMRRTARNMGYYLAKEPGGCFLALENGKVVGTIVSHVWGSVGWFGPLEVDPRYQDKGIGRALVMRSVDYLRTRNCITVGCETMAGSPRNIAFYHRLGFKLKGLSHVLFKILGQGPAEPALPRCVRQFDEDMSACRKLWDGILPGLDYSVELASLKAHDLGSAYAIGSETEPGHAIVHTHEMFEESQNAILKLLVAKDSSQSQNLLEACETTAMLAGKTGMFIRCYDATPPAINWFYGNGYRQQGVSVRLILEGPDESGGIDHISCWSG